MQRVAFARVGGGGGGGAAARPPPPLTREEAAMERRAAANSSVIEIEIRTEIYRDNSLAGSKALE